MQPDLKTFRVQVERVAEESLVPIDRESLLFLIDEIQRKDKALDSIREEAELYDEREGRSTGNKYGYRFIWEVAEAALRERLPLVTNPDTKEPKP